MARDDGSSPDKELWQEVDAFVKRFEEAWQSGGRPNIEDFLPRDGPDRLRQAVLCELVEVDLERRLEAGEPAGREDYLKRYPQLAINPTQDFGCPRQKPVNDAGPTTRPQQISRYQVSKVLGRGSFGVVYLARDDQLQRFVAIKVPHRELVARPEDAKPYLTEARTVAGLDHPNIVPVYDVGSTPDHPFFVVSKFIEGGTLAERIKENRPSVLEATELVNVVAETLHYAHRQGLVHRDIKPGNILLEGRETRDEGRGAKSGRSDSPLVPRPPPLTPHPLVPFVADFGLALRDQDFGKGAGITGTPAYLSPEQARGEGHRVDGRSDIFSLGVVFYELLTGMRPFQADTLKGLLEQIRNVDVRPPRQRDDTLPRELERICLKALSRRASERYTTAKDFADDLGHFLLEASDEDKRVLSILGAGASLSTSAPTPVLTPPAPPDSRPIKIVPKGLRSFDSHDADFFLELLPGPRDRDGLPDSIRFWKTKIEEMDADSTFGVGLIYGPSGCGKSSLVKAGLLPRLHKDVIEVYVEATAVETETRLLNGLRKLCPALSADLGLKEALATLRRGQRMPAGKKVLIVLDQFEQWLHVNKEQKNAELVEALRQCDGRRVQCILMVRDDFWLAVSRFLKELEVRLVEGENSALVDLFDVDHAKKVLAAFGRAFGKLSENPEEASKEHKQFLEQAITGLAQEGKVICVRLALFAEMMKSKTWTPASLKAMGGTTGVGVTFLEETFSAATAPPEHRYHQKAARAVLKALLPESGTDIKGSMRSYAELLEESGHRKALKDFDDLIHVLDSEVRLITPTDPEGIEDSRGGQPPHWAPVPSQTQPPEAAVCGYRQGQKYYELTHDYLVHSLREWLTRKQKETRRGRAELLLADRAGAWNARRENRQLPGLLHWLNIRLLTRKKNWLPSQRKMMGKAGWYYALRSFVVAAVLALVAWGSYEGNGTLKARALRDQLLNADTKKVLSIVAEMAPYRRWIDPLLRDVYREAEASKDSRKQLYASIALLPVDKRQKEYLYSRLLEATPQEVPVLRDALAAHQADLRERLWAIVEGPAKGKQGQRLRAASALAKYDPDNERWTTVQEQVVNSLVSAPPAYLERELWMDALWRVRPKLLDSLSAVYRDRDGKRQPSERNLATNILAEFAKDKAQLLADLLMDADEEQFPFVYEKLKEHGETGLTLLQREMGKQLAEVVDEPAKEKLAKRQANAAVACLRMGRPAEVWPLLKYSKDPRVRSYLIHRLGPLGADAGDIIKQLEDAEVTTLRALILSLGEFKETQLPSPERAELIAKLFTMYQHERDAGLHAAAEWLLRVWGQHEQIKAVDAKLCMKEEQIRNQFQRLHKELVEVKALQHKSEFDARWYINRAGQTMVVVLGPVQFVMGSPPAEAGREQGEVRHTVRIGRTFAIGAKAVTAAEYQRFKPNQSLRERDCPVIQTSWYEAAAYCNWLSEREGISPDQWCYETTDRPVLGASTVGLTASPFGQGTFPAVSGLFPGRTEMTPQAKVVTRLKKKYLSLTGYRLPTEAEVEFANRAGALTSRYYGESEELLVKYGWFVPNSRGRLGPVGSLMPNDLGLFDMHGNVWCWCQESYKEYPRESQVFEDKEFDLEIKPQERRVLRGGCYTDHAPGVRAAKRWHHVPELRTNIIGFRLARTIAAE